MTTDNSIKQHLPVQAELPITKMIDPGMETMQFPAGATILQRNFSGRSRPGKEFPEVVTVPSGYGFYWLRATNHGWTDNIDAKRPGEFPRPLEGFDFENKHQYIYKARRAQLVALAGDGYVAYDINVDASRGGTAAYENESGEDWHLYFYLNDRMDGFNNTTDFYFDNGGSANCDIVVFRLSS